MEGLLCAISFSLTVGGSDYTSLSVDLTFNSVTTSRMVTVATSPDTMIETTETFTVGFDQTVQSVDEGQSAMVNVTVMGGSVILDRDVAVTVMSQDETASML